MGILFVIIATLAWSFDTLIRYPLLGRGFAANQIVFFEHLFLAFIFLPIFIKKKLYRREVTPFFLLVGGLGSGLGTLSFTRAFTLLNPSLVILLQKFQPLVAIILASIFLGEKIKKSFIGWAMVCLVGGFLISFRDMFPEGETLFNDRSSSLLGYLFALIAIISWGSSTVFGKKLSNMKLGTHEIMSGRFLWGMIFLLPFYLLIDSPKEMGVVFFNKVLLMVCLSGLLGMFFYYQGLNRISARLCALVELFFPLGAVIINWIYLDQALNIYQLIGGALLLWGSTMIHLSQINK